MRDLSDAIKGFKDIVEDPETREYERPVFAMLARLSERMMAEGIEYKTYPAIGGALMMGCVRPGVKQLGDLGIIMNKRGFIDRIMTFWRLGVMLGQLLPYIPDIDEVEKEAWEQATAEALLTQMRGGENR